MNELVNLVMQKTGLPEDKARTAVETVLNYLKGKLPAPVAGQIDNVLSGQGGTNLGGMASDLGGILGGKK